MALKDDGGRPSRRVMALLVLACLTVMTLDARGGSHSPVDPLRSVAGNVVGPVESVAAGAVRPFGDVGGFFTTNHDLRKQVATLSAENSQLKEANETTPLERKRLTELSALTETAKQTGYSMVTAHVIALGSMQSFSRTATIDAGTSSGVRADMTVLNGDGLVGRVVRATRTTATVLLVIDPDSVVGGRLGSNFEIGFLKGRGTIGSKARLDLDLLDDAATPSRGDLVVTWGSDHGVPYVAGIPIGHVESVYSTPRQQALHAIIKPTVDFSSLDLVGVVVPKGTKGDRPLLTGAGETP